MKQTGFPRKPWGQIALIQGMVSHLPDHETIMAFVCRGLEIVPGTDGVTYHFEDKNGCDGVRQGGTPALGLLSVEVRRGRIRPTAVHVYDQALFSPYIPYLKI